MSVFAGTRWIFRVHMLLLVPTLIAASYLAGDLALNPSIVEATSSAGRIGQLLIGLVIGPLTVGVGLFCIRRVPGNVVGPILALWGCGIVQIINPRSTPWFDAYQNVISGIFWPACFYLFSYFPDGRGYPRRLEKLVDSAALFTYTMGALSGLASEITFPNETPNLVFMPVLEPFRFVFRLGNTAGAILGLLMSLASLTLRYRASTVRVRQQMKWLLVGLLPFVLLIIPGLILQQVTALEPVGSVLGSLSAFWVMIFPVVAIGNALLRHRLYDIDIIIRRTLVYSLLTASLALVYVGSVVLLQQLLRPLVGQESDLAIVASTLAIVALFQPLRRRTRAIIDRRFYRGKYDAQQTLQAFSSRLRDEVDLQRLSTDLLSVVEETVQPAHVSLWLRHPAGETSVRIEKPA